MSLSISIRFLTGRAHLHPWQTHHNEGRVEWPPSQWRLLRALVAVAGRGLTTLPLPDEGPPPKPEPKAAVKGLTSLKKRGVPENARKKLSLSKGFLALKEPLTDGEADAWKAANPGESFSAAIDHVRALMSAPERRAMEDSEGDDIPLSRLARLVATLSAPPFIWLPKTAGGHTRQYFPTGDPDPMRWIAPTGSAVFDTFATVRKDQPLLFHWPDVNLDPQPLADLEFILARMSYFGRAESWCRVDAHAGDVKQLPDVVTEGFKQTHWCCVSVEDAGKPDGKEYRDYTLERRLAPCKDVRTEVKVLLPRTKPIATESRPADGDFQTLLGEERVEFSLLRCLLRESGQDIKDGLERPIGTRWVHYAVPRPVYDLPRSRPSPPARRTADRVELVRFALSTATVHRAVLPPLTDTLLVADRFRGAALALARSHCLNLSGHEADGQPSRDHQHAFYWPTDDDNDGFLDHVFVYCPAGFDLHEVDALRRLQRLGQRGGRPDLLVTPTFLGRCDDYRPWSPPDNREWKTCFASATPWFCPLHRSHGKTGGRKVRPITPVLKEGLRRQEITEEVAEIEEIVFDHADEELKETLDSIAGGQLREPVPPRQFFPIVPAPAVYPPLPRPEGIPTDRYQGASLKQPDAGYPFGVAIGLVVDGGTRFIRALNFCRRRRQFEVKGHGRMFLIRFRTPRPPRPFALGSQCHFGLGLFTPLATP